MARATEQAEIYSNSYSLGSGWNNPTNPGQGAIFDIESVANDRSDATGHSFLAGTRAFGVWRSTNDGGTWAQKSSGATYPEVARNHVCDRYVSR